LLVKMHLLQEHRCLPEITHTSTFLVAVTIRRGVSSALMPLTDKLC